MLRTSALRSQVKQLRRVLDDGMNIDALAERLWLGLAIREEVIALELEPDRRTGKPRPQAPVLALKILDTVTCPMMVRERRALPPLKSAYCWQSESWTVDELIAFFAWFDSPDPDLYDLEDEIADRYREQLVAAERAWAGDQIVAAWMEGRAAPPSESLALLKSPPDRAELLADLESVAASL